MESEEEKISIGEFVILLIDAKKKANYSSQNSIASCNAINSEISLPDLLAFGHFRGWLDDSDERVPEAALNRQTAARIVHLFLRIECNLKDEEDISSAIKIKDLYNCRVCANHIAQVYVRGIMNAQKYQGEPESSDSPIWIFNHLASVSKKEAKQIIKLAAAFC